VRRSDLRRHDLHKQRKWMRYLLRRQNGKCKYCGVKMKKGDRLTRPTFDHVAPVSKGGDHHIENGVAACWECNNRKGDRL
jgi:5-methylcytosine-specific restriction endonuclease McrA